MKRDTAIQKAPVAEIQTLQKESDLARRGLEDLDKSSTLSELQDQMLNHFKMNEYEACIKVCKKLLKLTPESTIVKLLYETSKVRVQKTKRRNR